MDADTNRKMPMLSAAAVGASVMGFALVLAVDEKATREGSAYLDLLLGDREGQVTAKIWDITPRETLGLQCSSLVKIRGVMGEWQGKKQLRVQKIRLVQPSDGVRAEDFVESAPETGEDMWAFLWDTVSQMKHEKIQALVQMVLTERREKLLIAPAASRNHHAVRGGLLCHINTMLKAGSALLAVYPFLNKDLLLAGIVLHDLAKLEELSIDALGVAADYSREGHLLGHLILGIMDIDRLSRKVGMDRETALLLEHMVLSHHYEPEFGSPKRPAFPEAEVLHYLDILDARLYDMSRALHSMEPGSFSDRIWRLENRRLYRSGLHDAFLQEDIN